MLAEFEYLWRSPLFTPVPDLPSAPFYFHSFRFKSSLPSCHQAQLRRREGIRYTLKYLFAKALSLSVPYLYLLALNMSYGDAYNSFDESAYPPPQGSIMDSRPKVLPYQDYDVRSPCLLF